MQNKKIQLGFVKPVPKKFRFWFLIALVLYLFLIYYLYSKSLNDNLLSLALILTQLPLVIVVSLPSLFPEKEIFQLFVQFSNTKLLYRDNYLKQALIINYEEITRIEIKPTQVIIYTQEQKPLEISFNKTGFKKTQEIKANFEILKKEINK